mmetsp:Transcript_21839/g.64751  ORF Transcript_21839/g.64751 Transcript_21839/m.64751 type:complete len:380 (+) Transcript_21839:370-1509(+)
MGGAAAGRLGPDRGDRGHPGQLALCAGPEPRARRRGRRPHPVGALRRPGGEVLQAQRRAQQRPRRHARRHRLPHPRAPRRGRTLSDRRPGRRCAPANLFLGRPPHPHRAGRQRSHRPHAASADSRERAASAHDTANGVAWACGVLGLVCVGRVLPCAPPHRSAQAVARVWPCDLPSYNLLLHPTVGSKISRPRLTASRALSHLAQSAASRLRSAPARRRGDSRRSLPLRRRRPRRPYTTRPRRGCGWARQSHNHPKASAPPRQPRPPRSSSGATASPPSPPRRHQPRRRRRCQRCRRRHSSSCAPHLSARALSTTSRRGRAAGGRRTEASSQLRRQRFRRCPPTGRGRGTRGTSTAPVGTQRRRREHATERRGVAPSRR